MSDTPPRKRRRVRRALRVIAAVTAITVIAVALAPTLVSWGVGRGYVQEALARSINGSVVVDTLDLGWFGSQSVEGLVVTDVDDAPVARIDAHVNAGLLALLVNRVESLEIDVSGSFDGRLHEDGSTSFEDLLVTSAEVEPTSSTGFPTLKHVPPTTVRLNGVSVRLRDERTQQVAELKDLTGHLAYTPGGGIDVVIKGLTGGGSQAGSIELVAAIAKLVDENGAVRLDRATGRLDLELRNAPVPLARRRTELRTLSVTASSSDLTKSLDLTIEADAAIEGTSAGRLRGNISIDRPVGPDGTLHVGLDQLTGQLSGRSVPTALFQRWLRGTPIIAERDLGPTLDLDARFGAGDRAVTISAVADSLDLSFTGSVDPRDRSVQSDSLTISIRVGPELFKAATGMTLDRAADVRVEIETLSLPALAGSTAAPLEGAAVAGTITVSAPVTLSVREGQPALLVEDASVRFETPELSRRLDVRGSALVEGAAVSLDLSAARETSTWRVTEGVARCLLTPRLAAALQAGATEPIELAAPARVTVEVAPFDLPAGPVEARVMVPALELSGVADLAEPVVVAGLEADLKILLAEAPSVSVNGRASLQRPVQSQDVASARYAFDVSMGDTLEFSNLSVELADLSVAALDGLRGAAAGGGLAQWIGDRGNLSAAIEWPPRGLTAALDVNFPRVKGAFDARIEDDTLIVTADDLKITLPREAIQRRLTPEPAAFGVEPPLPLVSVAADVPLTLNLRRFRVPMACFAGEPFDPAAVDIDIGLKGGPLVLVDRAKGRSSIEQLDMTLRSRDLDDGVRLTVKGTVRPRDGLGAGAIDLDGRLSGLVTGRVLTAAGAELQMTAKVDDLHTAVVDAIADLRGLLVAALGPTFDARAEAKNLSWNSGSLKANIVTPDGWLDLDVLGRDGGLVIEPDKPVTASLRVTPPLCNRVLSRIHPMLADVVRSDQLLQATVLSGAVPLDGDVSRLDAVLEIQLGRVELNAQSGFLSMLALIGMQTPAPGGQMLSTVPAEFEPIRVRIEKGVVTYDRFAMVIDQFTMAYSGTIDLNTGQVNLKTEVPLEKLAVQVAELRARAHEIYVPVYTTGTFGNLKTEPDLVAVFEMAGRAAIKDQLEKQGIPGEVLDIFDGIFGKKK